MRRCRLVDRDGRIRATPLVAIAWIPLAAATLVEILAGGRRDSAALDPVMHVRLLVTLPLLFFAENLLELRCAGVVGAMQRESIVERGKLGAIVDRSEHLRDAWVVEAGIAIAVLAHGQISLWTVRGWSGLVSSYGVHVDFSFATLWCVSFALPLVQFLMFRWLWRWLVWTYAIVRLSRAPLSLNTLHPDRMGGLRALATPIDGFAIYAAALVSIFSAAWTMQIRAHMATVPGVTPTFVAFVAGALVAGFGPLLLFAAPLYHARYRDTVAYHGFVRRYVDEFRRKWILEPTGETALGSPDIQSLNDIGASYQASAETKMTPFATRAVVNLVAATVIPLVPVLLTTVPIHQIALRFGKMLFGI